MERCAHCLYLQTMPPKIYNTKEPLDLERLRLAKPTNRNGSHFIKTLDVDDPIYFLSPKCFVKQGFVKSGKKIFCDFVFSNEDSDFLAWLEDLEERSRKNIYDNRETWFETPLDEHDIESSMSSPYKPYKSGKYFIVRANVPTALDKINIKIYDENETETDPDNIKENTKVLAVFEFQGIRCSVRSFQFEIELKQMLVVEPEKLFEKCIIATGSGSRTSHKTITESEHQTDPVITDMVESFPEEEPLVTTLVPETLAVTEPLLTETLLPEPALIEESELPTTETPIEILDADFPLENITEFQTEKEPPLRLKSRNDVYYKLYKEMRQRAREAKREALANYLEAKRIKTTYLLEDLSDSESDEDDLEDMEA